MTWHYRVVKDAKHNWYEIREVYPEGRKGKKFGWTAEPCAPGGDTYEELIRDLEMMLADAKNRPVMILEGETLTEENP